MKDYYNYVDLNAIAIGNHEFDHGKNLKSI